MVQLLGEVVAPVPCGVAMVACLPVLPVSPNPQNKSERKQLKIDSTVLVD